MSGKITDTLEELGISLPPAPAPQGNYVPYVVTGNLVFLAGQIALVDGVLKHAGRVPDAISLDEAQRSARVCAINLITQLNAACNGDLERVVRCVKLGGFVACDSSFVDHPKVINGASDLMAAVFGDKAPHARFAVGASSLPLGASVEVDAVFEVR
ncbi:MAG: RidA family protein [Proteobacteria bacterium]|nr:RidA family protein [Pseudomonadota bacterium]MDA1059023.1 RidA family protein [Pseudomonadota bacterium]